MGVLTRFNNWIADKLAGALSTMAMFYGVAFLVLVPLHWQTPNGFVAWTQYVVSVFFQGVALPILGFCSKKEGARQAQLLKETHSMTMSELGYIKEDIQLDKLEVINLQQLVKLVQKDIAEDAAIHKDLHQILKDVHALMKNNDTLVA